MISTHVHQSRAKSVQKVWWTSIILPDILVDHNGHACTHMLSHVSQTQTKWSVLLVVNLYISSCFYVRNQNYQNKIDKNECAIRSQSTKDVYGADIFGKQYLISKNLYLKAKQEVALQTFRSVYEIAQWHWMYTMPSPDISKIWHNILVINCVAIKAQSNARVPIQVSAVTAVDTRDTTQYLFGWNMYDTYIREYYWLSNSWTVNTLLIQQLKKWAPTSQ